MRSILAISLLLASTAAFAGKFDNLPDVDPEQFQPGMEIPRNGRRPVPPPAAAPIPMPAPPPQQAGPPPGYVPPPQQAGPPPGYVPPEVARFAQYYDGYRGPRPYYRPYYNPQPQPYGPPVGYYGAPPVDPGAVILGVIVNQVLPAVLYNINRRRY
jgi:hypothetical protein